MNECIWKTGSTNEDGTKTMPTRCREKGCSGFKDSVENCREFMPLKETLIRISKKELIQNDE